MRSDRPPMQSAVMLLLLVLSLRAGAWAEVVERILAVVDGAPVFLSEVRLMARVSGRGSPEALEALIDERLMFREAARLPQAAVSAAEEDRALESLRGKLRAVTVAEEADLRGLARREAAIVKYIDFRFRPQVRVTDADVREAWEAQQAAGEEKGYEEAAPEIRTRLSSADLDRRVESWVKELRQGAQIRYNRESAGTESRPGP